MKQVIVSTTIHEPSKAIRLFDALPDWHLIVVGDLKTPSYTLKRGTYVSPRDQEAYDKPLSDAIGWNCVERRNIGLLMAYDLGAEVVALVDDDNEPYAGWGRELMLGREVEVNYFETDLPVFDPLGATNLSHLWHRGFPIQLVSKRDYSRHSKRVVTPQIQADLWNCDPDTDAICRMVHGTYCEFDCDFFPIASNRPSPFNSQNTFILRECLPHYFLYPYVGRGADIWASYFLQAKGFQPVYGKPSVCHARNAHDLTHDMRGEYLGYEHDLEFVEDLAVHPDRLVKYLSREAVEAMKLYQRHFAEVRVG